MGLLSGEIRMLSASVPDQNPGFNLGSAEFPIPHGRASPTSNPYLRYRTPLVRHNAITLASHL